MKNGAVRNGREKRSSCAHVSVDLGSVRVSLTDGHLRRSEQAADPAYTKADLLRDCIGDGPCLAADVRCLG